MSMPPKTESKARAKGLVLYRHLSKAEAGRLTGLSRATVISACNDPGVIAAVPEDLGQPAVEVDEPALGVVEREETADALKVVFVSDRLISTPEEAMAHGQIDPKVWKIVKIKTTSWQVVLKLKGGKDAPDTPVTKQLWRLNLEMEPILPKPYRLAGDAVFERFGAYKPAFPKRAVSRISTRPCLVEIDVFDPHFGKLAWARETGQDQDLKIMESLYRNAVDDLIDECLGRSIERFILTIGQDFFHVDSPKNETSNGTPQDADGRFPKIIEVGEMAMVWAVERLLQVAPVKAIYVPGNHDRWSSFHLTRTIAAWFRSSPDVIVDTEPTQRKYETYGVSLLGYTHGDETKAAALPGIMANAMADAWAAAACRQWRCGHLHTRSLSITPKMDTHDGCEVWRLSSLSAADAWHYSKGYVSNRRAAEAFVIDRDLGYKMHVVADART